MQKALLAGFLWSASTLGWSGYQIYDFGSAHHDDVDVSKYVPDTAAKWGSCHHLDGLWLNKKLGDMSYRIQTDDDGVTRIHKEAFPIDPAIDYISEILPKSIVCKDNWVNVVDRAESLYHLSFRLGSVAILVDDELPLGQVYYEGAQRQIQWSFGYTWVKGNN